MFERLGINDVKSRIIAACNGTEYFLASLIAIALIDRIGRRKLMLFGSVGQTLTMVLLAVLGAVDTSATQVVSAVLLFVFNSFFAVGWLGMTWLYVCTPLAVIIYAFHVLKCSTLPSLPKSWDFESGLRLTRFRPPAIGYSTLWL